MKAINVIEKIIYGFVVALFLFVLGVNLFMDRKAQYWMYYDFNVSNVLLFLVALIITAGIIIIGVFFSRKENEEKKFRFWYVIGILTVVLLILQCIVINNIYFQIGWDVTYLREAAAQFVDGGLDKFHSNYFENNPNNIFMYIINILFVKLGGLFHVNGYMMMVYTGMVLVNGAVFMTSLVVYKMSKKRTWAYISYVIAAVFFGLSPWLLAPYTDVFSVIVPIASLYIFLVVKESNIKWFVKPIIVVILPTLAYGIKPTNLFVLFALFVYEILQIIKGPKRLYSLFKILIGIGVGVIIVFGSKVVSYKIVDYKVNDDVVKPMWHYLMLGSNYYMVGQYNAPDDEYSNSFVGKDAKSEADIEKVKERYGEMSFTRYLKHVCNKTYLNYANGVFGWGKEGGFIDRMYDNETSLGRFIRSLYYVGGDDLLIEDNRFPEGGENFSIYASICQVIWYVVLMLITYKSVLMLVEKDVSDYEDVGVIVGIVLIGVFVFLTLFETNARYLYSFLPLFALYGFMHRGDDVIKEK